jgi:hypothetical protein
VCQNADEVFLGATLCLADLSGPGISWYKGIELYKHFVEIRLL